MTTEKIQDTFEVMDTLERAFAEVEGFPGDSEFDEFKDTVRHAVARHLLERLRDASAEKKQVSPSRKKKKPGRLKRFRNLLKPHRIADLNVWKHTKTAAQQARREAQNGGRCEKICRSHD